MQRYKTHPKIALMLEGGKRISFGARTMTSGGWQSIPKLAFKGGALIGCSAGFMNLPRIKGSHNAMFSGYKVAEAVFEAIKAGRSADLLENLNSQLLSGEIEKDLKKVRNTKPLITKFGTIVGTMLSGLDLWTNSLLNFSFFGTLKHKKPDHASLKKLSESKKINYPKPDGKITFDKSSSLFLSNITHAEDQPVHLHLKDTFLEKNLRDYGAPEQLFCPANVYEIIKDKNAKPKLQINAANCLHCKTCDIKDMEQNIDWSVPEGGSGPNYLGM
jgi:electron-transferring-flavoprotein dehydrogenase